MSKTIFYFSGTGNSLKTAKDIQTKINAKELISMSRGVKEYKSCQSDVIGFVFPVYFWGIPNRVFQFISNLSINTNGYIFVILTYGMYSGNGLPAVQSILRKKGLKLLMVHQ